MSDAYNSTGTDLRTITAFPLLRLHRCFFSLLIDDAGAINRFCCGTTSRKLLSLSARVLNAREKGEMYPISYICWQIMLIKVPYLELSRNKGFTSEEYVIPNTLSQVK